MSHLLRLLSAGIAIAVAVALTPATVFADAGTGPQTWAVSPAGADGPDGRASFDYVVEPDDVYADHVAVRTSASSPSRSPSTRRTRCRPSTATSSS